MDGVPANLKGQAFPYLEETTGKADHSCIRGEPSRNDRQFDKSYNFARCLTDPGVKVCILFKVHVLMGQGVWTLTCKMSCSPTAPCHHQDTVGKKETLESKCGLNHLSSLYMDLPNVSGLHFTRATSCP